MYLEITQKNKLEILGKLTASLSHELRNPLSAIKLNLDYMKMSSDQLPVEICESLENCIVGVKRIENLIENILSFSRKTRNSSMLVSINEISDSAINLTSAKASKEKVSIDTEYSDPLPKVEFSASNLLQVFLNLITNAIEACDGRGGKIIIRSFTFKDESNNDRVIWEISDNGIGIKEENKDKIFGEFFTNKERGTGIGLSVSRALLDEYNAHLEFTSEYGKGSTFKIIFQNATKGQNVEQSSNS